MTSTILDLYELIWELITDQLVLKDVLNLLHVGNPRLSTVLRRSVRRANWTHQGPFLDLNALLAVCTPASKGTPLLRSLNIAQLSGFMGNYVRGVMTAKDVPAQDLKPFLDPSPLSKEALSSLKELLIEPWAQPIVVKAPKEPLVFPPTLTTLYLHFPTVFELVLQIELSTMLPQLRSLSLIGGMTELIEYHKLDLPAGLTSLELTPEGHAYPAIDVRLLSELPRGLEKLSISGAYNIFQRPSWPPSLADLCFCSVQKVPIEHLPRTVTSLNLEDCDQISTTYPSLPTGMVFPWRRFFPLLKSIKLSGINEPQTADYSLLMRTLVLEDVLDEVKVEAFITPDLWDLPSLRPFQTKESRALHPYPSYKEICLSAGAMGRMIDTFWSKDFDVLSPYLANTDLVGIQASPTNAVKLKATSSIFLSAPKVGAGETQLSTSVTDISGGSVHLSVIPSSATYVNMINLVSDGEEGAFVEGDALPSGLKYLYLLGPALPANLFLAVPTGLTRLSTTLRDPSEWTLIAERLINLERLEITLTPEWKCQAPLSPISSTQLAFFALYGSILDTLPGSTRIPNAVEFFAQPSILPSSLREIELSDAATPWNASILAVLPPQLTSILIVPMVWGSSDRYPLAPSYPSPTILKAEDLLKRLPINLKSFVINGLEDDLTVRPDIQIVRHLPRSITRLQTNLMFARPPATTKVADLIPLVPPYLTTDSWIDAFRFEDSANILRPSGFMN